VLKKLGDDLLPQMMAALRFLRLQEGLRCVVERDVYDRLSTEDGFGFVETFYNSPHSHDDGAAGAALAASVDFVVCLGGDGVILHASTLFNNGAAPPIISFHLGSLGFLTSHTFENFEHDIRGLMYGDAPMDGTGGGEKMRAPCGQSMMHARFSRCAFFGAFFAQKHTQPAR
jgi:NAD+ kinase